MQTVVYLLFVRFVDLYEREELSYVIPVFLWGMTVAAVVSLFFNTVFAVVLSAVVDAELADFFTAVFVAPVVEECSKGLALLIAFAVASAVSRRHGGTEFSGVMDGIVYGSAVAFGFSIVEDIFYYSQFDEQTYVVRRIFGGFGHAAFTSLTGIGIGLIPWVHSRALKVILPLLGLSGAVFLHAAFNFTATVFGPVGYLVLFCVILLYILIIVVWLAIERRAIREELRGEVSEGTITAHDYYILPSYFRTTRYYFKLVSRGRLLTWSRVRKQHSTAVDLALAKRLARRTGSPGSIDRVRLLRRKILDSKEGATVREDY